MFCTHIHFVSNTDTVCPIRKTSHLICIGKQCLLVVRIKRNKNIIREQNAEFVFLRELLDAKGLNHWRLSVSDPKG